jgi:hypothetical protein
VLPRSFRSRIGAALATLAVAACASTAISPSQENPTFSRVPPLTPASRVIDAERIQRSGALTAWDAVGWLVPSYGFQTSRGSALSMLVTRDPRRVESSVRLYIDGHRMPELDVLRAIAAHEILAIHVLNPTEAATYFGPATSGGAIVIETRTAWRRR